MELRLEIKVMIRPFRSSMTTYLSRLNEGKGICQKCDARSEFLFLLVKAVVILVEA